MAKLRSAETSRDRILLSAQNLIMERGFAGTSIDDILKDAGLTKGAFFHYFKGKALSQMPGREREGLRHLERAAQLEPNNYTITADAAEAFLAAGMSTKASRLAQQALSIDPTNEKASEVMRRLEAPEEPEKDGGGLLGRLRRKG